MSQVSCRAQLGMHRVVDTLCINPLMERSYWSVTDMLHCCLTGGRSWTRSRDGSCSRYARLVFPTSTVTKWRDESKLHLLHSQRCTEVTKDKLCSIKDRLLARITCFSDCRGNAIWLVIDLGRYIIPSYGITVLYIEIP